MSRRFTALFVVAAVLTAIGVVTACSNQGEGEVCNSLNDSDDCQTDKGLVCYVSTVLRDTTSDRCCPADRALSTHPVCVQGISSVTNEDAAPAQTGPSNTTPDAGQSNPDSGSADASGDADAQP